MVGGLPELLVIDDETLLATGLWVGDVKLHKQIVVRVREMKVMRMLECGSGLPSCSLKPVLSNIFKETLFLKL
jgi:hypothetical protein